MKLYSTLLFLLVSSHSLLRASDFTPLVKPLASEYKISTYTLFNTDIEKSPKEYNLEDRPGFWYYTARFFIITGGSFPITFGLSNAIFVASTSWPTNQQMKYSLISAASLSASIALTDLIIGLVKHKKRNTNE